MWNKKGFERLQWLLYLTTFLYIARVCRRQTMWSTILHWLFQACVLYWNCTIFRWRVWRYAGNHSAVNATMNNKNRSKDLNHKVPQIVLALWLFPSDEQDYTVNALCCGRRCTTVESLKAVSDIYCYQHLQVTVWLWAIFPLWMWKRCKSISVNIWDSVIVSWNSFCSKWFFLTGMIWLDSDCNKWAAVCRTCCSLTDVNAKSYMCWREI